MMAASDSRCRSKQSDRRHMTRRPPPETQGRRPSARGHNQQVARFKDIVFDSPRPSAIARFWAAALDEYDVAPYDDAEIARLHSLGIDDLDDDPSVLVERADGGRPRIFFQLVPESKVVKNRVHIDLDSDDPDAEISRLVSLGARVVNEYDHLTTLADPDGNEFCVTRH